MNNQETISNSAQVETLASDYRAGVLNRRDFLTRLITLTGANSVY